jgi:hypothetical protein
LGWRVCACFVFVKLGTHLTVLGTSAGKHCDFFESVTLDNLEKTICQPKRGRQKGDKRETEGRQEGDRRETRGRQEGDKRETGAQRGLGWSFVILQQKNPFSEPKRIAYRYVLLTGLVLVFVLWLELSHCLQNTTTVNSYLALGDNAGLAALCCSLLLSAALCCSVLLSAALCYPLLLSAALCCPLLLSAALCCSLLLSVALCCSLLLSAALCCSLLLSLLSAALCWPFASPSLPCSSAWWSDAGSRKRYATRSRRLKGFYKNMPGLVGTK